ncbi:hypothetical protein NLU13_9249 [Sarocladium strictum]|uniref:Uncharacterized protein n=1 Tax=Sarocladium strictum TaxID=5046 RepID=A0AA39GA83_SARSR|nr:hypothetical protein NLU13_9249 [Sarocladium strictum]
MAANSFAFVDNFAIDGRSRREIRSHVMRGKNTTKARASKRRVSAAILVPSTEIPEAKVTGSRKLEDDGATEKRPLELILHNTKGSLTPTALMPRPYRRLQDTFSGVSFPVAVDDDAQLLIKQFYMSYGRYIYPAEFCHQQDVIDSPWFSFVLVDEAYCHGTLAISIACHDLARGRKKLSSEYKMYLAKCLSLLNQKLSGEGAGDTSTIALVTGLCVLSLTLGDLSLLKIHVGGLRNVIQHRGGIKSLAAENALVMEKAARADIEDALSTGCPAVFSREIANDERIQPMPSFPVAAFPSLHSLRARHAGLAHAAQEVHTLTQYLSMVAEEGEKLRPWIFASHVTYAFSKVLALGAIGTSDLSDPVADIVHLALAAILSVLTVQIGIPNDKRYDVLLRRFVRAVDHFMAAGHSLHTLIDPLLMNWILHVLPATILQETAEHEWLRPKMVLVRDLLGLGTWQEAHAAAQAYPWITGGSFHDKHIRRFWSAERRGVSVSEVSPSSSETPSPRYYALTWSRS